VDSRLAPEHPYPTPLEDCYTALAWLHSQPGVDHDRIAVGGASAGGGLAAALAQLALDRGRFAVTFQLLTYPMLDDRSAVRPARPGDRDHRLWNRASNRVGWSAYLGTPPSSPGLTSPAVPSRRGDLSGLAPTWIGVGSADLFHDEGVDYATRLQAARVSCELYVVPGAFHGFDLVAPKVPVVKDFCAQRRAALREALCQQG
jgi:acetyl esterase/lipase